MILASGEYRVMANDKKTSIEFEIKQFKPSIYQKAKERDLQSYVDGYADLLVQDVCRDVFVSLTFTFLEETGYKTLDGSPVYKEKKELITIKRVREWREE